MAANSLATLNHWFTGGSTLRRVFQADLVGEEKYAEGEGDEGEELEEGRGLVEDGPGEEDGKCGCLRREVRDATMRVSRRKGLRTVNYLRSLFHLSYLSAYIHRIERVEKTRGYLFVE